MEIWDYTRCNESPKTLPATVKEAKLIIQRLVVGPIMTNCYIIGCESKGEGAVIDPGGDAERIVAEVERLGLFIRYIINTHGHFDHILANGEVKKTLSRKQSRSPLIAIHPDDAPMLDTSGGAAWFGLSAITTSQADIEIREGDVIRLGEIEFLVLHTPGHSPGSISLYCEGEGVLFDGDVLFNFGIGRYDLPGGDYYTLMETIRKKLLTLPDETIVYSGHGPPTTIGRERKGNPFL
jgi:glyoxylase-like metal-dependent hydrolase (beta-lactamase superfamily II)